MVKLYSVVRKACWFLGMISLVLGLLLKVATLFREIDWRYSTRGALLLAIVFFVGALATRGMEHEGSS